jgi:RNA-directed DNA polymerase
LEPPSPFGMANPWLLTALARSFLAGESTVDGIVARSSRTLGRNWRWLRPLARRYLEAMAGETRPLQREVLQFFLNDPGFRRAWSKYFNELSIANWLNDPQRMQPIAAAATWDVPAIETVGDLAAWFSLTPDELLWFADLKGLAYRTVRPRIEHYHYRVLAKKSGAIRLIEAPKPRLKELQRNILAQILDRIPPHTAAHGFVKGRSVKTFLLPHVGQRVVLKMDFEDFFPSITGVRVQTVFRMLGYPEPVADLLGGICTNAVPRRVWSPDAQFHDACIRHTQPHLPQGAPTSPALANICAYRVDCRLTGLARSAGAEYTRYADDLAFSGGEEFERGIERFSTHVAVIVAEEGFIVNHRKTRIMRQGVRQRLAGLVANQHFNVMRTDFDRLKATLYNCVRFGLASQNRTAHPHFLEHLKGRIGWVESVNPAKGRRLRAILTRLNGDSGLN